MNRRLWDDYEAGDLAAEREVDRRIDEAVEAEQEARYWRRRAETRQGEKT